MIGLNMRPLTIIILLVGLISERWKSSRIICTLLILSISSLIVIPNALGLPNPAAEYCVSFGYKYDIIETPEGEYGICIFPDGSFCNEWDFYYGKCGEKWRTNVSMGNATLLWSLPFLSAAFFGDIAVSDNGNFIVFIGSNGSSVILMTKSGQKVFEVSADAYAENPTEAIDISGDGTFIIVGSSDNYAKIYKSTGELYFEYSLDSHPQSVSISKDGKIAVVGTENGLYIFDVVNKKLIRFYSVGCVRTTAISDNGEYIACGCGRNVYVFNKNGEKIWGKCLSLGEYECIEDVQISNNGLIAVSCTYSVYVFDVFSNKLISSETSCYHLPRAGVSPDGNYFVLAKFDDDHTVISLNNKDGAEIWQIYWPIYWPGSVYISDILISYNAKWILIPIDNAILLLDKNGNEAFRYNLTGMHTSLDMTTNGMYFAVLDYSIVEFFQNNLATPEETTCCPCEITTDKEVYNPGDQITITIKFCNEGEICSKSTKSIQIETKEEGRGTTATSRTNTIDTDSANRYAYYDYAYLTINDHNCVGYDVYVNGEYYFTENGDGKCGFYIPCDQSVTVELRKNGCKISETFTPYCGYSYFWEITENWCVCGEESEPCDPETFTVLLHKPSGTVDITNEFNRISKGVYRATGVAGDPGLRTIEVNVPGCSQLTKEYYVNYPPVADFTYTPQTPKVGDKVTFDASSSYDPDGQIVKYEWDFGDGNVTTTTEPVVTHVYTQAGSYTVTLTVIDDSGATSTISKIVTVETKTITLRFVHIDLYSYEYPVILLKVKLLKDGMVIDEEYTDKTGNVTFNISDDPSEYEIEYINIRREIPENHTIIVSGRNTCSLFISLLYYPRSNNCSDCSVRITRNGVGYSLTYDELENVEIPFENTTFNITIFYQMHNIFSFEFNPLWFPGVEIPIDIPKITIYVPDLESSEFTVVRTDFNPIRDAYSFKNSGDGVCYGMVSTAKLLFEDKYNKSTYNKKYNKIKINTTINKPLVSLPNFMDRNLITDYSLAILSYFWLQPLMPRVPPLTPVLDVNDALKRLDYGEPIEICIYSPFWSFDNSGHSLLAIGYIQANDLIYFIVYDPNHPYEVLLLEYNKSTHEFYYKWNPSDSFTKIAFREIKPLKYDWLTEPKKYFRSVFIRVDELQNYTVVMSSDRLVVQKVESTTCKLLGSFDEEGIFRAYVDNVTGFMNYVKDENGKINDTFYAVAYPKSYNNIRSETEKSRPGELDPLTIVSFDPENTRGITIEAETNITVDDTGEEYIVRAGKNVTVTTFSRSGSEVMSSRMNILGNENTVIYVSQDLTEINIDVNGDGTIDRNMIPPTAKLTYSVSGLTVTFDASLSYDPDGYIISYTWDFGDGNSTTTSSPIVQHTYTQSGNYTVTLTVTDNDGLTVSISKQIVISNSSNIGDVTGDGRVNVLDIVRVGQHFGERGDPGWIPEDLNKDGIVNILDIVIIGQNWTG